MRGLREAGDVVDLDYPPFFIDRAEDAVRPARRRRRSGDPQGNDSGGRGSPASWLTVSQSAATPMGSSRRKPANRDAVPAVLVPVRDTVYGRYRDSSRIPGPRAELATGLRVPRGHHP